MIVFYYCMPLLAAMVLALMWLILAEEKRPGLHRAFDLSRWAYFLDFILVPGAVSVAFAFTVLGGYLTPRSFGTCAVAGVIIWTLLEYWVHREVFHRPSSPFEPMHQMHHRLPKDMIGVASWGTFTGFAGLWALASVWGVPVGAALTSGVMLGYLGYCAIHVRMHHGGPARGYLGYMQRHHVAHHRGGRGNFGVTSPVWDVVFRTHRPV